MIKLCGKSVFGGIAFGRLAFYKRIDCQVVRHFVENSVVEIQRFDDAREQAAAQLTKLYDSALVKVGRADAMIFEIHRAMLSDPEYCETVNKIITTQRTNAEYAVKAASEVFSGLLAAIEDAYMKARAADVKDVSDRLLNILSNTDETSLLLTEPAIVAADDLAPSETVRLDKDNVLGFVTVYGAPNSHTAILARTMGIPAVIDVGENLLSDYDGHEAAIDGGSGTVYIDPDEETVSILREKQARERVREAQLKRMSTEESVTLDGRKIEVFANIGTHEDVDAAVKNGADGIGLFRSEFLYLGKNDFPTEEEQFGAYKTAAERAEGKTVIIRTLDVGADKRADYFCLPEEQNPALGCRAIRLCLEREDIFKTQLRAIYRASAFGKIAVMFPMIISVEEVRRIKKIVNEVKNELRARGEAFDENAELGVMIETPAAAMISDELADEVDFFSIGTNDLEQYTLAIDRQNHRLDGFYKPCSKSVLRLIKLTIDNARKKGITVGICGEIGADISLTEALIGAGVRKFSVPPPYIPLLRKRIREINAAEAEKKNAV